MRIAAIDVGTNSVLLLVAERREGELVALVERATITRLGEKVDATGELAEAAKERTLACLERYAAEIRDLAVERVAAVGTSAMRDARGGGDFADRAERILGVRPQVVSGEREAELTFAGALSGLPLAGEVAVFDIGGGSTEIIRGKIEAEGKIEGGSLPRSATESRREIDGGSLPRSATGSRREIDGGSLPLPRSGGGLGRGDIHAVSLDIGAVRLTERHVSHDPPAPEDMEAIRRDVREALGRAPKLAGLPLVGVAGTVTTIAAYTHDVAPYDPSRIHGATLTKDELAAAVRRLAAMPLAERKHLAAIDEKRADVIVAGGIIAEEIVAAAAAVRLTVSDRGVRWGLAASIAGV